MENNLLIVLGNQLFPLEELKKYNFNHILMIEDYELCTYEKHHKSKILLFLTSMREYRDSLSSLEAKIHYFELSKRNKGFFENLSRIIDDNKIDNLLYFNPADKDFGDKLKKFINSSGKNSIQLENPMFLLKEGEFNELMKGKRLFMADFYKKMRRRMNILMDFDKPEGGKWSYDDENRKKLPKEITLPTIPIFKESKYRKELEDLVNHLFSNHPGSLNGFLPPTNRKDSLKWLDVFLKERFNLFGDYEDALHDKEVFLFHSLLSPLLNIGLLTPEEVINKSINYAKKNNIPINSLEGFIRQIIGWREFIKGVYDSKGSEQMSSNFFKNKRKLKDCWYEGSTGIEPLDKAIKESWEHGYTHHINRLMVISNIMNLVGIAPKEIYRWFMEMYIDSSDWVMIPNVFGMSTYADGGLMSTKPYICGSNYLLKMSNFKRGDWCEIVDGLYWSFISKNSDFFKSNPRLSLMTRSLERMDPSKKERIFKLAENFINKTSSA